jgi:phosphonate transport system permease protein
MSLTGQRLLINDAGLRERYPRLMGGDWAARVATLLLLGAAFALFAFAFSRFDFSFARIGTGFSRLAGFIALMVPPDPGEQLPLLLKGIAETLAMAFLGTLLAAVLAFPIGLLAARNVLPNFLMHFLIRRSMDSVRAVDALIWALIWIGVVGLGPFAGILAIATTDVAALAKLFSESIENADAKGEDGVAASGAGPLLRIRFGLLPEALPVMASQVLYFMESNTRSATSLGIVGAGGIGLYINESIRTLDWAKVAFEIILILIAVSLIDVVSSRLRRRLLGAGGQLLQ